VVVVVVVMMILNLYIFMYDKEVKIILKRIAAVPELILPCILVIRRGFKEQNIGK
jgi:hypothetical protein